MKRALTALLLMLVLGACTEAPKNLAGGDELGNGGDMLPKLFEAGRAKAQRILDAVTTLELGDVPGGADAQSRELVAFYADRRQELSADVASTPAYEWVPANRNSACGETSTQPRAAVKLSYRDCRSVQNVTDAALHLVGESAHHLGMASDQMTARLAVAVGNAWKRYLAQWPDGLGRRLLFEDGRWHLTQMLGRVRPADLPAAWRTVLVQDGSLVAAESVLATATDLSRNFAAKQVEWSDEPLSSASRLAACAVSEPATRTIKLSYSGCDDSIRTRHEAAQVLLVAELTARLADEGKATRVAQAVAAAWANAGHPEFPHWVKLAPRDDQLQITQTIDVSSLFGFNGDEILSVAASPEDLTARPDIVALQPRTGKWRSFTSEALPEAWRKTPYERSLHEHQGIGVGRKLVAYAWCHKQRELPGVGLALDPATRRWSEIRAPEWLAERREPHLFAYGETLIVWGGTRCNELESVVDGAYWSAARNEWRAIPPLPQVQGRVSPAVAIVQDHLIVWGGCTARQEQCFSDGWAFDGESWRALPNDGAPSGRSRAVGLGADAYFVVFGGWGQKDAQGTFGYQRSGARFDLRRWRWLPMNVTGAPESNPGLAVWAPPRVVTFGFDISFYHPRRDAWTTDQRLPTVIGRQAFYTGLEIVLWQGTGSMALFP